MPAPESHLAFAALLNDARRGQHLSIRAVARIADVPPATAQGWLNGQHFPSRASRDNYLRLLEHLDLVDAMPLDLWDDESACPDDPEFRTENLAVAHYPVGATVTGSDLA